MVNILKKPLNTVTQVENCLTITIEYSKALKSEGLYSIYLHIVPVESAFPEDQQVSLRVGRAESLLTEGHEGPGARQIEQRWHSVRHSVELLVEKHRPRWKIGRPHALQCSGNVKRTPNPLRRSLTKIQK